MTKVIVIFVLFCLASAPAHAGCSAEYKAKQDNPLRLDYGVVQVPDDRCSPQAAQGYVQGVLAARGWILLNLVSVKKSN